MPLQCSSLQSREVFNENINASCVAVYAIARGVTRPLRHNVLATSRRLDVTSETSVSLQAEDGEVKNRRKAYSDRQDI